MGMRIEVEGHGEDVLELPWWDRVDQGNSCVTVAGTGRKAQGTNSSTVKVDY
jgi:hypothetical protein